MKSSYLWGIGLLICGGMFFLGRMVKADQLAESQSSKIIRTKSTTPITSKVVEEDPEFKTFSQVTQIKPTSLSDDQKESLKKQYKETLQDNSVNWLTKREILHKADEFLFDSEEERSAIFSQVDPRAIYFAHYDQEELVTLILENETGESR